MGAPSLVAKFTQIPVKGTDTSIETHKTLTLFSILRPMAKKAKKSPARSRRQPNRKKRSSGQQRRWFSWSFVGKAALVCLVLGAAGLAYLDALVRERFDAHVWQLPAGVCPTSRAL
ncbi:hypothetical protein [Alcanivorax sp.]|uniref:hypothetical protein n=1 Tax=Alcanivorax sp. TaxID=1872427 RepID=UPI0025C22FF3|nr:hypothetical protein [Alcanivorax sp.]